MDGVLADFFHEYAKLAGVTVCNENGRFDYRLIPEEEREPTIKRMAGTDFFYRLPKFDTADELISIVLEYVPHYSICSSPLRYDHENSANWKAEWIKHHMVTQPRNMVFIENKERHAVNHDGSRNILIDDHSTVLERWENKGGIGIKYQADEDHLDVVRTALASIFKDR